MGKSALPVSRKLKSLDQFLSLQNYLAKGGLPNLYQASPNIQKYHLWEYCFLHYVYLKTEVVTPALIIPTGEENLVTLKLFCYSSKFLVQIKSGHLLIK